jgi:hypothetical protein
MVTNVVTNVIHDVNDVMQYEVVHYEVVHPSVLKPSSLSQGDIVPILPH